MLDEDTIQAYVEGFKYMWSEKRHEYALIHMNNRYLIYHKPTKEIDGTELEEVNERIWANMIAVGVKILNELPE